MRYVTSAVVTNQLPRSHESVEHLKMTMNRRVPHVMPDGPKLACKKSFASHYLVSQRSGCAQISSLVTNFTYKDRIGCYSYAESDFK